MQNLLIGPFGMLTFCKGTIIHCILDICCDSKFTTVSLNGFVLQVFCGNGHLT